MKRFLTATITAFLLLSVLTSFAAAKIDLMTVSLDKLSDPEKRIISITLSAKLASAGEVESITGSIPSLGIRFSDYSTEELRAFCRRLKNEETSNRQENENQSLISAVTRSAEKHFNNKEPVHVNLYGRNLLIEVTGNQNMTTKLIKAGMLAAVYDVMNENRAAPIDFDFLISFPMIDKYGNREKAIVMKVTYKSETMARINWDRFLHIDVESVADRYWEHPAFSK